MKTREQYQRLTHSLHWDPTYVGEDAYIPAEWRTACTMPDWKKFNDPFQILFEDYIRIQAEKEDKFHAVRDAGARFGHISRVDPRWVEAMKSFNTALTYSEYYNYRGHVRVARFAPAPAIRIASMVQAMDERRHAEEAIYQAKDYVKHHESGFLLPKDRLTFFERHWYFQGDRSFFEDLITTDPIEAIIGTNLVFETAFTNLLFIAAPAAGVANGDFGFGQAHLTIQSDETRHMALGQSVARAMLQNDDTNLELIQDWMDKWFWRCHRLLLAVVGPVLDYFPKNKPISYKEAFRRYVLEDFIQGYVSELSQFGLKPPRHLDQALAEIEHGSHTIWRGLYASRKDLWFDVHQPTQEDLAWLNDKYPAFAETHAPFWRAVAEGANVDADTAPMICDVCQFPCVFPEPAHAVALPMDFGGRRYWFCSEGCQWIFEREPHKYTRTTEPSALLLADKDPAWVAQFLNITPDGTPLGGTRAPEGYFPAMPVPATL
jgi:phenol/toluene 2-monooxygenase (NADH) P3/A3